MKKPIFPIKRISKTAGIVCLAACVLFGGCQKTGSGDHSEKNRKKPTQSTTGPDEPSSDPSTTTVPDTFYHLDATLWSADIPNHYTYDKADAIDTDEMSLFYFEGDPGHPDFDYFLIRIVTESAEDFRNGYQFFIAMDEYAAGTLPTTEIGGFDFVEYTTWNFGAEIDAEETHYLYRYENASMTIDITLGSETRKGSYLGGDILYTLEFSLPDLGLQDPPFAFESGEFQSQVQELPLGDLKVTPSQAHFSEHVFKSSENGRVPFSSTACYVATSEKYLYTCESGRVYIYLITDDEMTLVDSVVVMPGCPEFALLDGDTVVFYCDPDPSCVTDFFFVETVDGKETTLSCLSSVVVSPDGQHILRYNPLADQMHMLSVDPDTNDVVSEKFEFHEIPLEGWDLQYVFMTDTSMFARFSEYNDGDTRFRLFEYDFDGYLIREWEDETRENLYTYALFEFGDYYLVVDQDEDTIRLVNKEGNTEAAVKIGDLIGIDSINLTHYSLVKVNDQGDFLLVYAHYYEGILEDLVYHIHIG